MIDHNALYSRYIKCHGNIRPSALAAALGIARQTVIQWKKGTKQVPWLRLKELVDDKNISWDWLLTGRGEPSSHTNIVRQKEQGFDTRGINTRFLKLFPEYSQTMLGEFFDVSQVTVSKWRSCAVQIPWEKLEYAVDAHFDRENNVPTVTWDWLLEGFGGCAPFSCASITVSARPQNRPPEVFLLATDNGTHSDTNDLLVVNEECFETLRSMIEKKWRERAFQLTIPFKKWRDDQELLHAVAAPIIAKDEV